MLLSNYFKVLLHFCYERRIILNQREKVFQWCYLVLKSASLETHFKMAF